MKTASDIMFIKLNREEMNALVEPVLQSSDALLHKSKKFTVPDLWHIHRRRRSFERRGNIFSK